MSLILTILVILLILSLAGGVAYPAGRSISYGGGGLITLILLILLICWLLGRI